MVFTAPTLPRVANLIDGQWVDGSGSEVLPVLNPATGAELTTFTAASAADVDRAVAAARVAQPAWAARSARQRSEALLLNILPAPVAERLKHGDAVVDGFEEVSVLFADIVGFTPMSAGLPPGAIVDILNDVFSSFDRLAERNGLEKIKTIGDAYLAVGGIPVPQSDHVDARCSDGARHAGGGEGAEHRPRFPHSAADRGALPPGGGGRHRAAEVQLRPMGRHREHREPNGVSR